jgi:hypothetical protein
MKLINTALALTVVIFFAGCGNAATNKQISCESLEQNSFIAPEIQELKPVFSNVKKSDKTEAERRELLDQSLFVFSETEEYAVVALKAIENSDYYNYAYIDWDGNVIRRAYPFDNGPDYFKEGLARYLKDEKIGFMNEDLEVVIPAQFDGAHFFEDGFARVCSGCKKVQNGEYFSLKGGCWGRVDKEGKIIWDHETSD